MNIGRGRRRKDGVNEILLVRQAEPACRQRKGPERVCGHKRSWTHKVATADAAALSVTLVLATGDAEMVVDADAVAAAEEIDDVALAPALEVEMVMPCRVHEKEGIKCE